MTVWIAAWFGCGGHLPVETLDVGGHSVRAEIAATEETRARGLMYRDSMPEDSGMLFVYEDEKVRSFWMKDTRMPLAIAFLDRHGTVVWLAEMRPMDTDSTSSMVPAAYALEMNAGWFERHDVARGAKVGNLPPLAGR